MELDVNPCASAVALITIIIIQGDTFDNNTSDYDDYSGTSVSSPFDLIPRNPDAQERLLNNITTHIQ